MRAIRPLLPLIVAGAMALMPLTASAAAAPTLSIDTAGPLTPGTRIGVTVHALPAAKRAYCLGLASAIDRYGLPVSLGRVTRDRAGTGRLVATIPTRLLPAEPAGPFLLFVGTCTPIAPDRPFVARTFITVMPAHQGQALPSTPGR